jgi:hypothetical protein
LRLSLSRQPFQQIPPAARPGRASGATPSRGTRGCQPRLCHFSNTCPSRALHHLFIRLQLSVLPGTRSHRFGPCFQHLINQHITALASPHLPRFPFTGATRINKGSALPELDGLYSLRTPPRSMSCHRIRLPFRFQPREIPKPVTYPARHIVTLPITTPKAGNGFHNCT